MEQSNFQAGERIMWSKKGEGVVREELSRRPSTLMRKPRNMRIKRGREKDGERERDVQN